MSWQIGDSILDTREIEKQIDELEGLEEELDDARAELMDAQEYGDPDEDISDLEEAYHDALECFSVDDAEELKALRDFRDEIQPYCTDWYHGEPLIHEDYREDYAQQLAEDLHNMRELAWPFDFIDWEAAADALFQDYTSATIDGETYYVRCS